MDTTTDPRPLLDAAFTQIVEIAGGVRPEQLPEPTPCTEFDVRSLLGHSVFAARRVAKAPTGPVADSPTAVADDVPDGGWKDALGVAAAEARSGWADDERLGATVHLPYGDFPGAVVVQIYSLELVTHAWDLARATGQTERLDPGLAEAVLPFATQMLPPEARGGEMPFAPVIAVSEGAPPYERLAGWMGRNPR